MPRPTSVISSLVSAVTTTGAWRWAALLLAVVIAALRPDLPVVPLVALAIYVLLTTALTSFSAVRISPLALGLLDVAVVSVVVLTGGGERSPVYIVYVVTALDVGTRVGVGPAAAIAVAAAAGYTAAAWAASDGGIHSFDAGLAAARGFLFLAAALTSSSLSTAARLARLRAAEADALNNLMRLAAAAALDLPAVLAAIVTQTCAALQADCGVVFLQPDGESESSLAVHGLSAQEAETAHTLVTEDELCRQVLTAHGPVLSSGDRRHASSALAAACGAPLAYACAPLVLESDVMGVLWIARRRAQPFSSTECRLLSLMGQQAALAVRNARLHALQKRTVAELQEAEQAKTAFLSIVSHELRTPLTAIRASAGLLLDGKDALSPTQMRLVRSIARNTDRLTALVTDLLDMARLQSGRLPLSLELIDIRPIVRSSVAALRPLMEQRQQHVEIHMPSDLQRVMADPRRVEQILTNLLSNAHYHCPQGTHVTVTVCSGDEGVMVSVADDGPGVADDERERIFQRFYRGRSARCGEPSGVGLGLAVAKSLVELHGGHIGYRAAPYGGSEFFFILPLQGPKQREDEP